MYMIPAGLSNISNTVRIAGASASHWISNTETKIGEDVPLNTAAKPQCTVATSMWRNPYVTIQFDLTGLQLTPNLILDGTKFSVIGQLSTVGRRVGIIGYCVYYWIATSSCCDTVCTVRPVPPRDK